MARTYVIERKNPIMLSKCMAKTEHITRTRVKRCWVRLTTEQGEEQHITS